MVFLILSGLNMFFFSFFWERVVLMFLWFVFVCFLAFSGLDMSFCFFCYGSKKTGTALVVRVSLYT